MRIAILTTSAGVPGTLASSAFIGAIADGLRQHSVAVLVVGLTQDESSWRPAALGVSTLAAPWLHMRLPGMSQLRAAGRRGILDKRANIAGYDWQHAYLLETALEEFADGDELTLMFYPRSSALIDIAAGIATRRGWRLVVLSTEALSDAQIDPKTRDAYITRVAESADGVWAMSSFLRTYWENRGIATARVFVNPPVVRSCAFEDAHAVGARDTAVYVGNLMHREIEYLLEIAARVRRSIPSFQLVIFGDADEQRRARLGAAVKALGLETTVRLEAAVAPWEIPRVLSQAQVLVLPRASGEFSTAGFPNKLGEYLASGVPVVVTAVGDIPQYLVDATTAFLVEPDDCDAFANAVVTTLTNRDLAERVGREGRSVALRQLETVEVTKRLLDFIESLPSPHVATVPQRGLSRSAVEAAGAVRLASRRLRRIAGSIIRHLQAR